MVEKKTKQRRPIVKGFTIDGPYSLDLDDAIWVEKVETGWRCDVSIADVDARVKKADKLDDMAYARCFTRYYAGERNKPMLPRAVSERKSSLIFGKTRPTVTVSFTVDNELNINDIDIKPTALKSSAKLSYEIVDEIIRKERDIERPEIVTVLKEAHTLSNLLLASRRNRGALAIYDVNKGWRTNEEGQLVPLTEADRHMANIIIQELMIATNCAVARFMVEHDALVLFRNHTARPVLGGREALLEEISIAVEHPDKLDMSTLRERVNLVMNRATYNPQLGGHYGLNLPAYLHFTSPIRRYADLINHRLVKAVITQTDAPYTLEQLERISLHINNIQNEIKDARSESFKSQHKNAMRRVAASGQLENLDIDTFHRVIKIASRESSFDDALIAEIHSRLEKELLQPRDFYYLLLESNTLPKEVKHKLLEKLINKPFWVVSIFEIAGQHKMWPEPRYSTEPVPGGYGFKARIMIGERTFETKLARDTQKKAARQKAALALLALILDAGEMTSDKTKQSIPERIFTPDSNPKGRLNELAQMVGFELRFDHEAAGPDHNRTFTAKASAFFRDRDAVTSEVFSGNTKREAERQASADLLMKLQAQG